MNDRKAASRRPALLAAIRQAARQEQFLEVVSAEEAAARFARHIELAPLPAETVTLAAALARVLARDVAAPIDVPPFDRSNVDGFALRAADTAGASDTAPVRLRLNAEVIVCGHAPGLEVVPGSATTIATGGVMPRGADAVAMVEHTDLVGDGDLVEDADLADMKPRRRSTCAVRRRRGNSSPMRAPTSPAARSCCGGARAWARARSACWRPAASRRSRWCASRMSRCSRPATSWWRRAIRCAPAEVYDSNGAIIAAAVIEAGGEPIRLGAIADDEAALERAIKDALACCDLVLLSGGTSKGAGDLSHRVVSRLGSPGILVHGVALKPGKPLCLAVVDGKPLVVLPGFPTSAIFTFHTFVAPVIRALAGLPPQAARTIEAQVPVRIASELGRKEFVLVALVAGEHGPIAFPIPKGSGAVTSFSQADGFLEIDALASALDAGTNARVTLIGQAAEMPDLVIMGSHCVALDVVLGALAEQRIGARTLAVGSMGGVAAAQRGECDLAPVHLLDPTGTAYNTHLLRPGLALVKGWQRMQGFVYRQATRASKAARRVRPSRRRSPIRPASWSTAMPAPAPAS